MKDRELLIHMKNAENFAQLSNAVRKKVGAVLVTETGVTVPGVNGTPSGADNCCEYRQYRETYSSSESDDDYPYYSLEESSSYRLVTKPNVIHAELNCILKCAKEGISTEGATMFLTLSPCQPCAAMLAQAGVKKVYYREQYRDRSGIDELVRNGVEVENI